MWAAHGRATSTAIVTRPAFVIIASIVILPVFVVVVGSLILSAALLF